MLAFLIFIRPFKERGKNNIEIFNETTIFICAILLFGFSRRLFKIEFRIAVGWIFCSILITNVAVNMMIAFCASVCNCCEKCKRCCRRMKVKRQAMPEEDKPVVSDSTEKKMFSPRDAT